VATNEQIQPKTKQAAAELTIGIFANRFGLD